MAGIDKFPVKFRPAKISDWKDISRISSEVSKEGVVGDYINDIGKTYMEIGQIYVAETDRMVGFQHVQDVPDGSIYLSGLRVLKEYRRRGIATGIIKYVIRQWLKSGKKYARTLVEDENTPSLALMSGLGFMKTTQFSLYYGSIDTTGFEKISDWPEGYIDIGHVPCRVFPGIDATLYRKGTCLISRSNSNKWGNEPTYTVINHEGCAFQKGKSFVVSHSNIPQEAMGGLVQIPKFEHANLLELSISGYEND